MRRRSVAGDGVTNRTVAQQAGDHGVNILHVRRHLLLHGEVDKIREAEDRRPVLFLLANILHVRAAVRVVVVLAGWKFN